MIASLLSLLLSTQIHSTPVHGGLHWLWDQDYKLLQVQKLPHITGEDLNGANYSANAIYVMDEATRSKIYAKNPDLQVPIASITKLMTASIILEENSPNEIVTVSPRAGAEPGSRMGLASGDQLSINALLHGLLIESGNDAAIALAEHNAGSVEAFVEKMNRRADELGLKQTSYGNPTGLDNGEAYSSAHNVAVLAAYLLKDPGIRAIVQQESTEVYAESGKAYPLQSTNQLLGEKGVAGLKTGRTDLAGECFVSLAKSPDGHNVITVVLGSADRFGESSRLLDWIYTNVSW